MKEDEIGEMFSYYGKLLKYHITRFARDACDANLILDAGCGDLRFSRMVANDAKALVISMDINASYIYRGLESQRVENIIPIVCDLRKLPLRSSIVDAIIVINVLHHLPMLISISEVLYEFRRVCKRNARIFIKENVSNNPFRLLLEKIYRIMPVACVLKSPTMVDEYSKNDTNYHLLHFTAEQLSSIIGRHEFKVIKEDRQELFLYFAFYLLRIFPLFKFLFGKFVAYTAYLYKVERSILKHFPFSKLCLSISLEALSKDT